MKIFFLIGACTFFILSIIFGNKGTYSEDSEDYNFYTDRALIYIIFSFLCLTLGILIY